jgi:hypothetical protein
MSPAGELHPRYTYVIFLTDASQSQPLASPGAFICTAWRGATHVRSETMKRADKLTCSAAVLLMLLAPSASPANAQSTGFMGAGGEAMMTQMAPLLEMMKAKMGKKRFAALMQTMGPMMIQMMQNGSFGGMSGFGGMPTDFGGYMGGGYGFNGYGVGSMDMASVMGMIAPMMQMANFGGSRHHRIRRRH